MENAKNDKTLEDAAKDYVKSIFDNGIPLAMQSIFIKGAKWQAEQNFNWFNDLKLMEIELRNTKTLLASCEKALEDRDKQAESQALKLYTEDDLRKAYNAGEQSRYSRKGEALLKQEYFDDLKNK